MVPLGGLAVTPGDRACDNRAHKTAMAADKAGDLCRAMSILDVTTTMARATIESRTTGQSTNGA